MHHDAKIYVAGHTGLVGSAICRRLGAAGYRNLLHFDFAQLDLRDPVAVEQMFSRERPEYVLLAAAKVGGIHANDTYPGEFIYDNLMIQANVLHSAWRSKVRRLLFLGSSCIYPRDCPQPIREEYLLTGPLEKTNEAYAVAKIAGLVMADSYNKQYGTEYVCAMPCNLYGPNDNFDPMNSHVLPALIRRVHLAKVAGAPAIQCWGTGRPLREFLYSDDLADALISLLNQPATELFKFRPNLINIGYGEEITIEALTRLVCKVIGYQGELTWDPTKPDGTPRKLLDGSRMLGLGWRPKVRLEDGIRLAYQHFLERHGPTLTAASANAPVTV